MSFQQYIHDFYDDIINPPFENKNIKKKLVNLRQKLAKKSLMFMNVNFMNTFKIENVVVNSIIKTAVSVFLLPFS